MIIIAKRVSLKPIISPRIPRKSVEVLVLTYFCEVSPNLNSKRILSLTLVNSSFTNLDTVLD